MAYICFLCVFTWFRMFPLHWDFHSRSGESEAKVGAANRCFLLSKVDDFRIRFVTELLYFIYFQYAISVLENLEMCGNTLDSKAYYFLTVMLNTRRSHQVGHHQLQKIASLRSLLQAVDPIGTAHGCGPTGGRDTGKSHQEMFSDFQKFQPEIFICSEKILKFFIKFALRIATIYRITWILVQKKSYVVTVVKHSRAWLFTAQIWPDYSRTYHNQNVCCFGNPYCRWRLFQAPAAGATGRFIFHFRLSVVVLTGTTGEMSRERPWCRLVKKKRPEIEKNPQVFDLWGLRNSQRGQSRQLDLQPSCLETLTSDDCSEVHHFCFM